MFCYSVYGLYLQSNQPVPGLEAVPGVPRVDVRVELAQNATMAIEAVEFASPINQNSWRFNYPDGTKFIVDAEGTAIWATWINPMTLEDTATYLLGPILGFLLRLRGVICLHASAVVMGQGVAVFVGPAGAGKSTTAALFAHQGDPILSDDVVALLPQEEAFWVQPAYPYLRLWPSSVQLLYGAPDVLPPLTPNWEKCYLALTQTDYRFQQDPLPLRVIYLLRPRRDDLMAPEIQPVAAAAALVDLIANTYGNSLLDKPMRAMEFQGLSRLVTQIPVRCLTAQADPPDLFQLCDAVRADVASLSAPGFNVES
ncbi:hypothetical protein [Leptolyngbya sp. 'hensonii']|uniref:hypothetical protein n=1 Tax=Leptolyngbya sp. 'hensonii' TaxID=1922337 RepID=UPI001C0DDFCE|nr:hypothetical protein [Leptolyngbya sp. 'hensonii']